MKVVRNNAYPVNHKEEKYVTTKKRTPGHRKKTEKPKNNKHNLERE